LPNIGPYTCIYDIKISGFTRSSIYIYDISRLRVKVTHKGDKKIMKINIKKLTPLI
jgi:hypothetical protein